MVEEVAKSSRPQFAIYNKKTGEIQYADSYILPDHTILRPITDEEVLKGYITLPEEAEEYSSEEELDQEINDFIRTYLDIPDYDRQLAVYNIKKSHVYEKFPTLNYCRALGEPGAGKSRYLDVIGGLHRKSVFTSGTITSAALFRLIEKFRGSVIIDEADLKMSDATNDVIKIINQGYERNRPVIRCDQNRSDQNDTMKLEFFDPFCPKILATRKQFDDAATESRCLTTVMRSTGRRDIPPNLNQAFYERRKHLLNKLLLYRFKNYDSIDPNAGEKVDLGPIEPRLRQVSTGFIALFAHDTGAIERFKSFLARRQRELVEDRANSWEGCIVKALCELTLGNCSTITAKKIIEQADLRDKEGKPWQGRKISPIMKVLGFSAAKPVRTNDEGVVKAYDIDKDLLASLATRYVADEDIVNQICNCVTDVTNHAKEAQHRLQDTVTNEQPYIENGYNGYTVTKVLDLIKNEDRGYGVDPAYITAKYPDADLKNLEFKGHIYFTPDGRIKTI